MNKCKWTSWYNESIVYFGSLMEYIRQTLNYMRGFYSWMYKYCKPPAKVLEAGCGIGFTAVTLAGMGYDVMAIDREPKSVGIRGGWLRCWG